MDTIHIYRFDELCPESQSKALDAYRNYYYRQNNDFLTRIDDEFHSKLKSFGLSFKHNSAVCNFSMDNLRIDDIDQFEDMFPDEYEDLLACGYTHDMSTCEVEAPRIYKHIKSKVQSLLDAYLLQYKEMKACLKSDLSVAEYIRSLDIYFTDENKKIVSL